MTGHGVPNRWLVTVTVILGALCIGLTMSMMNLAIPLMISALHTDIETIQWIITGPMLVNIALIPLVSWLTSLIGTRHVYLWAISIWIATSLPCGLSDTPGEVIFYRLLQGIGGSLHIPTAITVLYQAFPPQQRGLAMGIQQGAHWAAPAIGMTLGGYLLQLQGWQALFFYPIPIGLVSIGLAAFLLPNVRGSTRQSIDWVGLATLTPALTLLLYTVSQSQRGGWDRAELMLLLGATLGCAIIFGYVERQHDSPLLDFKLFYERTFSAASTVYFLNNFAAMGVSFAVIVFLQKVLHYSPLQVGLLLVPAMIGRVLGELSAGHLSDRWGARGLSMSGLLLFAIACGALGQLGRQPGALWLATWLTLGNIGIALSTSPILYAGLRSLQDDRISMGSGILSLVYIIGGTFGVGVVGPLVALGAGRAQARLLGSVSLAMGPTELLSEGYQLYFGLIAILLLGTTIPASLVRSPPRRSVR